MFGFPLKSICLLLGLCALSAVLIIICALVWISLACGGGQAEPELMTCAVFGWCISTDHSPRSRCCGLNCVYPNYICWSSNPLPMWLYWWFKEMIKVKWSPESGALICQSWCPYKKLIPRVLSPHMKTQQEGGLLWARKVLTRAWPCTYPSFSLQNCEKMNFCCLSHPVYILLWQPRHTKAVGLCFVSTIYFLSIFKKNISSLGT